MNTSTDYSGLKECSYNCKIIGCMYSCRNTSKDTLINTKIVYKCMELSCNQVLKSQTELDLHIKQHIKEVKEIFEIIGEKRKNNINFLPPPYINFNNS
jgi:hypothetical protein